MAYVVLHSPAFAADQTVLACLMGPAVAYTVVDIFVAEVALQRLPAVTLSADVGRLLFEQLAVGDVFVAHVALQRVAFAAVSALPGGLV